MAETSFDLIVVGGGPGGYVAAIRAAQLGMKTAVVEREHMGGICLNWGCIPTKALLRTSEVYGLIKHADAFGLTVKDVSFDPKKIVERSRKVAAQLSGGVKFLLKKNGVTVFDGAGKLAGPGKVGCLGLGTAAVVVIDETVSIVDFLHNSCRFFAHESCGQCTPCREGTAWSLRMLERIRVATERYDVMSETRK